MPHRCAVFGCNNTPHVSNKWEDFVSLHAFPDPIKDGKRHAEWVRFVKKTRKDFDAQSHKCPRLCNKHFADECFENKQEFLTRLNTPSAQLSNTK